jgi:glutathione S-transferase
MLNVNMPLLAAFGLSTVLLSLKALFLGAATASKRGKLKSFLNAEDAVWLGGAHVRPDPEEVGRLGRAHRNDLENLLPFFACGLLYVVFDGMAIIGDVYCAAFLISRVVHTMAYLAERPMARRNAYTVGFAVIAIMALHSAWLMAQRLLA